MRVVLPSINDQVSPKDNAAAGDSLDSDINPSGANFGFTDIYAFGSNLISIVSIDAGLIVFRTPTATRTPTPINVGTSSGMTGTRTGGRMRASRGWLASPCNCGTAPRRR